MATTGPTNVLVSINCLFCCHIFCLKIAKLNVIHRLQNCSDLHKTFRASFTLLGFWEHLMNNYCNWLLLCIYRKPLYNQKQQACPGCSWDFRKLSVCPRNWRTAFPASPASVLATLAYEESMLWIEVLANKRESSANRNLCAKKRPEEIWNGVCHSLNLRIHKASSVIRCDQENWTPAHEART